MNYLENNVTKVNNSHCNSTSIENFYIGYSTENSVAWFTVLSTLGIIVYLSFIGYYLVKKWIRKSQQKSTRVSKIQNIFTLLSVFELFISILWLYQSIDVKKMDDIMKNTNNSCTKCQVVSHISLFIYVFDWLLLTRAIYQFKCMIQIPITAVLNPNNMTKHLIIAFIGAGIAEVLVSWVGLEGVSVRIYNFLFIANVNLFG